MEGGGRDRKGVYGLKGRKSREGWKGRKVVGRRVSVAGDRTKWKRVGVGARGWN